MWITIPFLDEEPRRALEPFAPSAQRRFELLRRLSEAGVSTGIAIAPVIPGLNESDVAPLLERAHRAGARAAFMTPLRLPAEVKQVFFERLRATLPGRAARVENGVRAMRGGRLDDSRFGARFEGRGERWSVVQQVFDKTCKRLGLEGDRNGDRSLGEGASTFRRPRAQLPLF